MVLKFELFALFFLANMGILSAQNTPIQYSVHPQKLKFGESYYQSNLRGLSYLMDDLSQSDSLLHAQMYAHYISLQKRNQDANLILGLGLGASAVILAASTASLISTADEISERPGSFAGAWIAAAVVGVGAGVVSANKRVKHEDILNFVNALNRNAEREKILIGLLPELQIGETWGGSLTFSLKF